MLYFQRKLKLDFLARLDAVHITHMVKFAQKYAQVAEFVRHNNSVNGLGEPKNRDQSQMLRQSMLA